MALQPIKKRKTHPVSNEEIPEFASPNPPISRIKSTVSENSGTFRDTDHASTNLPITGAKVSNSSLRELQVNEMLAKIQPGYGRRTMRAEDALRKLKRIVEEIPECESIPVSVLCTVSSSI